MFKSTEALKNVLKTDFKDVLNYIPHLFILGLLAGFGSYTALTGAFIITLVFLFFGRKYSFIYGSTVVFVLSAASLNVSLGGRSETLFALLFISSLITILFSFLNVCKKTVLSIPKPVSNGFITGCFLSAFFLCIPLILGEKTFCSFHLMLNTKSGIFNSINENAFIIALLTVVIYNYLLKLKIKYLPSSFTACILAGIASFLYNFNLDCINLGYTGFTPVTSADFGHFVRLFASGILLSIVMTSETLLNLKALKKTKNENKVPKKILFLTGISNLVSSITGSIAGVMTGGNKTTKTKTLVEAFVLFIFIIFFNEISPFITAASIASILAFDLWKAVKNKLLAQKNKTFCAKAIFLFCLLITLYNIILGIMFSIVFTLIMARTKQKTEKKET